MKNQIFVVEGKNDVNRLKSVFKDINVISVNGSAVDGEIVKYLNSIKDKFEIVVCTDPDFPGLKIRNELEEKIGNVSHVFLERHKSFSNNRKKIGLEHLSKDDIIEAFSKIYRVSNLLENNITMSFLVDNKIIGSDNSSNLRKKLEESLNLGHTNGKTLLKRLNQINIKEEEILEAIK